MYALISPVEPVKSGYRVAQVEETPFDVASPLFWVECSEHIKLHPHWYSADDQTFYSLEDDTPSQ